MTAPVVSVVSAWFNRTEGLVASVQSVLDQEGVDFEYIIVDDCSSDETSTLLDEIQDPRLRVLRNPSNLGFTRSITRAVAAARGALIAVHGAGDFSHPGRLQAQVAFLQAHPDHVAVGTGIENHNPTTGERYVVQAPDASTGRNRYSHGEVMYRRADYEAVGGYRSIFYYAQDVDLWRRLGERGRLGRIEDVLYERRIFSDGVHSNKKIEVMQAVFSNLGAWSALERRRTGVDPVDRHNGRALLSQQRTQIFRAGATTRVKAMVKAGRLRDALAAMHCVPVGMLTGRLLVLYCVLRLFLRAPPQVENPPLSVFSEDPPERGGDVSSEATP